MRRFPCLVFYREHEDVIDVWRLLHGVVMAVKDTEIDQETARTMVDVILKGLRTDR